MFILSFPDFPEIFYRQFPDFPEIFYRQFSDSPEIFYRQFPDSPEISASHPSILWLNKKVVPLRPHCGVEQRQLVGLITRRS